MSKFKKKNSEGTPKISTASLPDIIFMLMFFFMVSTVMRETTLKVEQVMPEASEVQKLERKNLVSYIYVGEPKKEYRAKYGTEAALQLNDSFEPVDKIKDFVYAEKESSGHIFNIDSICSHGHTIITASVCIGITIKKKR